MTEIEFDLPAEQFALMDFPNLQLGQTLTLQLETHMLTPDVEPYWYHVQSEKLSPQFVRVGRAQYGFAGQIDDAYLTKDGAFENAALLVQCGEVPLRVLCAPRPDGRLPYGTWETRYVTGYSAVFAIVEDSYEVPIGKLVTVTLWSFRRLVLEPGDAMFGEWHETDELPPVPYSHDRVVVTARVHKSVFA